MEQRFEFPSAQVSIVSRGPQESILSEDALWENNFKTLYSCSQPSGFGGPKNRLSL